MARGRFLSESVAKDIRLNSLSVEAELVYLMTIPHLDRDGLIEGDTEILFGTVCPKRRIFIDRMGEFIQEWVSVGLVTVYESSEGQVLWFKGFAKNQLGLRYDRETPSKFPPPPGYSFGADGITLDDMPPQDPPPHSDSVRQNVGHLRQMSAQVEVKDQVEGEDMRANPTQRKAPPPTPTRKEVTHRRAQHLVGDYAGCDPKLLTMLTNQVKRIYGYDMLIDSPGDDKVEDKMRREAYRLWKTGFTDEEAMTVLESNWLQQAANFKIKRPQGDQLYELAINLQSRVGGVPTPTNGFHKPSVTLQRVEGEDW